MDFTNREKRERIATQCFVNIIGRIPGDAPKAVEIAFKATDLFMARLLWPICRECKTDIDPEETVWVDPATGKATTGKDGQAYHVHCAPDQPDMDETVPGPEDKLTPTEEAEAAKFAKKMGDE